MFCNVNFKLGETIVVYKLLHFRYNVCVFSITKVRPVKKHFWEWLSEFYKLYNNFRNLVVRFRL